MATTQEQLDKMQAEIEELKSFQKSLTGNTTIPLEVGEAFKARLEGSALPTSTHTVASETQAVNESGGSSYNVLKIPDGFVVDELGRNIPFYT